MMTTQTSNSVFFTAAQRVAEIEREIADLESPKVWIAGGEESGEAYRREALERLQAELAAIQADPVVWEREQAAYEARSPVTMDAIAAWLSSERAP